MSVIPLPSLIPATLKLKDAFADDVIFMNHLMTISDKLTAAQILAFAKISF